MEISKKETDDLKQELMDSESLEQFLFKNEESFASENVSDILLRLFNRCELTKADLARHAGMSEIYLHQIFGGRRTPSRNRLLSSCFGLHATLEETQMILQHSGLAQLYPRVRRDSMLIYGLIHEMTAQQMNERLFAEGEETLF